MKDTKVIVLVAAVWTVVAIIVGYILGYTSTVNVEVEHFYPAASAPATDAEIWETYHDCDMYGLPDYAREECGL